VSGLLVFHHPPGDDRNLIDCPRCGQAARVDLYGDSLSIRCFAECGTEEDIAARLDIPRLVAELTAIAERGRQR
jgi:hypothetical protein